MTTGTALLKNVQDPIRCKNSPFNFLISTPAVRLAEGEEHDKNVTQRDRNVDDRIYLLHFCRKKDRARGKLYNM